MNDERDPYWDDLGVAWHAVAGDAKPVATSTLVKRILGEGRPALLKAGSPEWIHHASYQWDAVGHRGELMKGGFAGQLLYVDRERDVVVAMFGTNATLDSPAPQLPVRALLERHFPAR